MVPLFRRTASFQPQFPPLVGTFAKKGTGVAAKKEERGPCMNSEAPLSHQHCESHRTSNDERHLLAPSSRHGGLAGLKARAARRGARGRDARCARRRIRLSCANADDSNCRDDGLAPVGKCTGVHDGAGRRRSSRTACGACASA